MSRQAQAAVLFLIGTALLHAGLTNLYLRYVKAGLQPLLLLSGVVLIVAALATAWYEWRRARAEKARAAAHPEAAHTEEAHSETHAESEGEGHGGHVHREPRISWLLLLPLFALILVAPPALGSYSAVRTGTAIQQPYGLSKLPDSNPLTIGLVDYATRAVYDHGHSLGTRQLKVTGFVALDKSGAPYLVRMALNCCAADAQPVKIALTGKIPPVLQPDTWLLVTGTYSAKQTKDPVNNRPIPYFQVTEAKPVPTPKDPYDESWNQ
ncbi:putative membrane protein [Streptomyces sp. 3213]|uniref:TIGR03943 family putative permease subunit n=1 Tax=Streptomyces sp. 3213.3 TaxID=1855348 RepID=UPI00089467BF|nr:TIGR03943 family protein [Streptomyces sp. 3213.3]SED89253.1 putative membrane protein [Streptomyces sp. 3213] [Streptomyces sp. 3213.3]